MVTYATLRQHPQRLLGLTGLTLPEFDSLLPAFLRAYQRLSPADRTATNRPRQRAIGGGRIGALQEPEQKLLFLLVYLKTYPLQTVMGELFSLSQPRVNYWLRRLLPILRDALDELGVRPQRDAQAFGQAGSVHGKAP